MCTVFTQRLVFRWLNINTCFIRNHAFSIQITCTHTHARMHTYTHVQQLTMCFVPVPPTLAKNYAKLSYVPHNNCKVSNIYNHQQPESSFALLYLLLSVYILVSHAKLVWLIIRCARLSTCACLQGMNYQ